MSTDSEFAKLRDEVGSVSVAVKELKASTSEIVEAFQAAKGAFKALEFLGKLVRPVLWICTLGGLMLAAAQSLKPLVATHLPWMFK